MRISSIKSRNGSIAARAVAVILCGSFALPLTACNKRNYKGEVDKFIDVVGSELGGSDYVLESVEDASDLFFETRDLEETRLVEEWFGKDYRSDYFAELEMYNGLFYRGEYKDLWDQYEERFREEETFFDAAGGLRKEFSQLPVNPTGESLIALLESRLFGLDRRAVELMRPYSTEDAVYYSNNYYERTGEKGMHAYSGMRVIFKSTSDAKEYWSRFVDVDDSYKYALMMRADDSIPADYDLNDKQKKALKAFHDMDEENYEYDEKKNEGHMTLHLGLKNNVLNSVEEALFSIKISGREVTMLSCYFIQYSGSLKKIGKLYEELDLNNPLDTDLHGVEADVTPDEFAEYEKYPDQLARFFLYYARPQGAWNGVGIADWSLYAQLIFYLPAVKFPEQAAWVLFEYDDPWDYLDELQS